jgi:hypothetical protein
LDNEVGVFVVDLLVIFGIHQSHAVFVIAGFSWNGRASGSRVIDDVLRANAGSPEVHSELRILCDARADK